MHLHPFSFLETEEFFSCSKQPTNVKLQAGNTGQKGLGSLWGCYWLALKNQNELFSSKTPLLFIIIIKTVKPLRSVVEVNAYKMGFL
jgi:hypothetical protein